MVRLERTLLSLLGALVLWAPAQGSVVIQQQAVAWAQAADARWGTRCRSPEHEKEGWDWIAGARPFTVGEWFGTYPAFSQSLADLEAARPELGAAIRDSLEQEKVCLVDGDLTLAKKLKSQGDAFFQVSTGSAYAEAQRGERLTYMDRRSFGGKKTPAKGRYLLAHWRWALRSYLVHSGYLAHFWTKNWASPITWAVKELSPLDELARTLAGAAPDYEQVQKTLSQVVDIAENVASNPQHLAALCAAESSSYEETCLNETGLMTTRPLVSMVYSACNPIGVVREFDHRECMQKGLELIRNEPEFQLDTPAESFDPIRTWEPAYKVCTQLIHGGGDYRSCGETWAARVIPDNLRKLTREACSFALNNTSYYYGAWSDCASQMLPEFLALRSDGLLDSKGEPTDEMRVRARLSVRACHDLSYDDEGGCMSAAVDAWDTPWSSEISSKCWDYARRHEYGYCSGHCWTNADEIEGKCALRVAKALVTQAPTHELILQAVGK
ncbi:MAG TPA: hypothetical protein VL588_05735 [Bdellovibrionota bacterium]|nr:hypothetical protein [Bdellovibrionota bacterium]